MQVQNTELDGIVGINFFYEIIQTRDFAIKPLIGERWHRKAMTERGIAAHKRLRKCEACGPLSVTLRVTALPKESLMYH